MRASVRASSRSLSQVPSAEQSSTITSCRTGRCARTSLHDLRHGRRLVIDRHHHGEARVNFRVRSHFRQWSRLRDGRRRRILHKIRLGIGPLSVWLFRWRVFIRDYLTFIQPAITLIDRPIWSFGSAYSSLSGLLCLATQRPAVGSGIQACVGQSTTYNFGSSADIQTSCPKVVMGLYDPEGYTQGENSDSPWHLPGRLPSRSARNR